MGATPVSVRDIVDDVEAAIASLQEQAQIAASETREFRGGVDIDVEAKVARV